MKSETKPLDLQYPYSAPLRAFSVVNQDYEFDTGYEGWYARPYWGEEGAGSYYHLSEEATKEYQANYGDKKKVAIFDLSGNLFDARELAGLRENRLEDDAIEIYRQAILRWREISLNLPGEREKNRQSEFHSGYIRGIKECWFEKVAVNLDGMQSEGLVPTFLDLRHPASSILQDGLEPEGKALTQQYGITYWLAEREMFGLFLKAMGYDGSVYLFNNGMEACVMYDLSKAALVDVVDKL